MLTSLFFMILIKISYVDMFKKNLIRSGYRGEIAQIMPFHFQQLAFDFDTAGVSG